MQCDNCDSSKCSFDLSLVATDSTQLKWKPAVLHVSRSEVSESTVLSLSHEHIYLITFHFLLPCFLCHHCLFLPALPQTVSERPLLCRARDMWATRFMCQQNKGTQWGSGAGGGGEVFKGDTFHSLLHSLTVWGERSGSQPVGQDPKAFSVTVDELLWCVGQQQH